MMVKNLLFKMSAIACLIMIASTPILARTMDNIRPDPITASPATPAYCNTYHNVGRIALGVSNDGTFGTQLAVSGATTDCFTGDQLPSCEFPKASRTSYLFGAALWMGAVLGRDTLVSTAADGWSVPGNEFHPDESPFGDMIYRSTIDPARPEFDGAVSEQDYIAVYYDTCRACTGVGNDEVDNRAHSPLNVQVSQNTYSWSYSYAQDFVLFDYAIKNIGTDRLRDLYMGLYVDADIHDLADLRPGGGAQDDFCGFRRWQPALYLPKHCAPDSDEVNIAWTADNQGDMDQVTYKFVPHITATRIVRTPSDDLSVSFNWWVSNGNPALDYGPMRRDNNRDYGTGGLGTPSGDRNKFFILSNGDFDFDQPRVGTITSLDEVWLPPPGGGGNWALGLDTRYVLSFGPFDVEPGQSLPVSLAYVAGLNFHLNPENLNNLPDNPDSWYQGVNFDSLGSNATWAEWVYDNPGVDTDSDGYSGEFTVCNLGNSDSILVCDTTWDTTVVPNVWIDTMCYYQFELADTIWRTGDGVPDFRGATPPPAPSTYSVRTVDGRLIGGLRVEPQVGQVRVRWNGVLAENTPDVFSREIDFEGYRVYAGRDDRRSSYSVVASYDIEDFNRYEFDDGTNDFKLLESPFTLEELRCLYAPDSCADLTWHPLDYPRHRPLVVSPTEIYYFEPQDFNQSILANDPINANSPILKTFPDAPLPPVLEPDSIRILFPNGADSVYLTEEGFIKAFEYEYTIETLLPTVPYWINVSAFDYGSPSSGLAALETSPTLLPTVTYPLESVQRVADEGLEVFTYPNPYRLDGAYRGRGFEARGRDDRPDERERRIHFANLPAVCTISIYTIDGDLVREIEHDFDPLDPLANHDTWDLITRNSQAVVSGIYYWTIEDQEGNTQIGKFAVIM